MELGPLKQQLPRPYNQDLSGVLTHMDRRTPENRAKLANDPVTAAYLAAAMRLVRRQLGPGAERRRADPDDEDAIERPLLAFLSQRAIADEVNNNPHPFPRAGNVATLRSTWQSTSHFIADLLNFGLWIAQYPQTQQNSARDKSAEQLFTGDDPVQAVHDLAYWESSTVIDLSTFRLRLVATVSADGDKSIAEAIAENLDGRLESFKPLYREFLRARGLQLRAGITLDDIANMLQVSSTGVAERMLSAPSSEIIDHDRRRSLLGTMALAVIYACLEPTGDATGLTLEQAVASRLNPPKDPATPSGILCWRHRPPGFSSLTRQPVQGRGMKARVAFWRHGTSRELRETADECLELHRPGGRGVPVGWRAGERAGRGGTVAVPCHGLRILVNRRSQEPTMPSVLRTYNAHHW